MCNTHDFSELFIIISGEAMHGVGDTKSKIKTGMFIYMCLPNIILLKNVRNSINDFPFHIELGEMFSDFNAHTHDFSELFIIISGEAMHEVDDTKSKIKAGDVYLIRKNMAHAFKKVDHLKICNIMFKDEAYFTKLSDLRNLPGFQALFVLEPQFRKEHQFKSRLSLDFDSLKHVITLIDTMNEDYCARVPGFRSMFIANVLSLIVYLSRIYTKDLNTCGNRLLSIANAVSFMESRFDEPVTLNELSAMAGMSPRHFTRIFKQGYGQSPINYLINLRIGKAITLLKETNLRIIEIAFDCGFSDNAHFTRIFKESTGMTPTVYRKYNHNASESSS